MALLDIVTSLGPSLLSGIGNLFGTKSANDANAEQNAINRQWQSGENKLNRDWQTLENYRSRDFTKGENQVARDWQEKMWNLQNEYNTPSAMMERYREAGLNPFISGQIGQGAGAAGSPASSATAPMGSPGMVGAPSSIPMQAPRFGLDFGDLGNALGVSANIANVNARTSQQKWETYAYIRNNVSRSAAKEFLNNNPDMLRVDDPENNPYLETYQRSKTREDFENSILEMKDWLLSRYGDQEHQKALAEADSRIENIVSQMNERDANIGLMTEQLATEVAKQYQLYASGNESNAKAVTENQIRHYLINKFVIETGLAAYTFKREKSSFDSEAELRAWLTSQEGQEAIRDMEKNGLLTNPSEWVRYFYQFLDHLPFAAGANANLSRSKVIKP